MLKLKIHTKTIIFLVFFQIIFGITSLHAQNSCSDSLKHAIDMYDEGLYEKVFEFLPKTMENCKYKGNQKVQASKILISSAYESDEIEYADSTMQQFLKKHPNYAIQANDPQAFINSLNKFKIIPRFSMGLKAGISKPEIVITKKYHIYDVADYSKAYTSSYSPLINFFIKFHLNKQISFNLEASYISNKYEREIPVNDTLIIRYLEKYKGYTVPILIEYNPIEIYGFSPSIFLGAYLKYYNYVDGYFSESLISGNVKKSLLSREYDNKEKRNVKNYGYIYGGALNYNYKNFNFFINAQYSADLLNFTKTDYNIISELNTDLFYIDDIFKLESIDLTIGLYYTIFYKVKKKW